MGHGKVPGIHVLALLRLEFASLGLTPIFAQAGPRLWFVSLRTVNNDSQSIAYHQYRRSETYSQDFGACDSVRI